MSSFLMLTKHGLPDLLVETGKKISKDPVLLSGLFKAIYAFSTEVAESPLQLLQIKGFTIRFISFNEDYILIIGADKNISNLNSILDTLSTMILKTLDSNSDLQLLEGQIKEMLENNLSDQHKDDIQDMIDVFDELSDDVLMVIFWGILTGKHFHTLTTRSLDFNKYVTSLLSYFDVDTCTVDNCPSYIKFTDKKGNYIVDGKEYLVNKRKFIVSKIMKKLLKLGQKHYFHDLKVLYNSINSTINSFIAIGNRDKFTEAELKDINIARKVLGMEMEHYCLEQLKLNNIRSYEILIKNTDELEWINTW